MPKYKLTYFPLRARAEVMRYLLFLGGQEWEEDIIEFKNWPSKKKEQPFGQTPVLEEDGVVLCQSVAICSYLARKYGYAGSTPLEATQADMIACCCEDIVINFTRIKFLSKTSEERKEGYKKFQDEVLPVYALRFENMLKQNKGGDGWIVGDSLTWADISLYHWLYWFKYPGVLGMDVDGLLVKFPKLAALLKRVEGHPKVAEYLREHPQADEKWPDLEELMALRAKLEKERAEAAGAVA